MEPKPKREVYNKDGLYDNSDDVLMKKLLYEELKQKITNKAQLNKEEIIKVIKSLLAEDDKKE